MYGVDHKDDRFHNHQTLLRYAHGGDMLFKFSHEKHSTSEQPAFCVKLFSCIDDSYTVVRSLCADFGLNDLN